MELTKWRDLKHKASPEEMETIRREAVAKAEEILRQMPADGVEQQPAEDRSGKAA